jgi:RNA polymerase sigma-70 factor, ECF subfamily
VRTRSLSLVDPMRQLLPFRSRVAAAAPSRAAAIEKLSAVPRQEQVTAFMTVVSPHLRAGYGLARWLLGNDHDAEDAAQDAYIRAFRHFDGWNGVNARAWLLTIVRRCCYTFLAQNRASEIGVFDEEQHSADADASAGVTPLHGQLDGPERAALRADDARLLNRAVAALPVEYREVFVLRELEGLSYKEIADVAAVPIGTVMSRLSRARALLQKALRATGETP